VRGIKIQQVDIGCLLVKLDDLYHLSDCAKDQGRKVLDENAMTKVKYVTGSAVRAVLATGPSM
jgi:hypothetical protein